MSLISRVLIEVESSGDHTWAVRFTMPNTNKAWQKTRTLKRTKIKESDVGGYSRDVYFPTIGPHALPDPNAPHSDLCTGANPEALTKLYRRITRRAPVNNDVQLFGRYLFDTLIGPEIWDAVVQETPAQVELLELALAWKADQNDLHRLNWEMMHGPSSFLAAKQSKGPREIAITRVVHGAEVEPRTSQPVPQCLFVIGTSLTDFRIRPGAELMGLLRQIERSERAIRTRVVRGHDGNGATAKDVVEAVTSFEPDLVHFICHGEFNDRGGAELQLAPDPNEPGDTGLRDAKELFKYLNAGGRPPGVVVLSACNTGQSGTSNGVAGQDPALGVEDTKVAMRGAHQTAPLAAALVQYGIPVVIGMAGRIADSACRHFTRRFGEALAGGKSIVRSTAEGRRAAFAYSVHEQSVDWSFPAVFLSPRVPTEHAPAPSTGDTPPVEVWVKKYHDKRSSEPAFWGRQEFFDAYYDLFEPATPAVLGALVVPISRDPTGSSADAHLERGYGQKRLIRELTVQAIRDGHVPVVVSSDDPTWEPPSTLPKLLSALYKALIFARNAYDLPGTTWQIELLMNLDVAGPAGLDKTVRETYLGDQNKVTASVIREALSVDLTHLIRQAHEKYPFLQESRGSAILFLERIHRYPEEFLEGWFSGGVLTAAGLRPSTVARLKPGEPWDASRTVLPVIMTFSQNGPSKVIMTAVKERGRTLTWMRTEKLEPFPRNADMDLVALQNVLLNPFDTRGELQPGVSNRAFALNYNLQPKTWNGWAEHFRAYYCGLPSWFASVDCYRHVSIASLNEFLLEADDEVRLSEYMK